ncbi:MAG TPA: hypothetical protein VGR49_07985 [Actinomycetota bacterium]|jgi:hypothetical protein|nr:hypothetical protein [Actinomycetota bacterium]
MGQRAGFDWARLTMGQKGVLITGVLLFIDLLLPWNKVGECPFCVSVNGWSGMGVIAGLLVVALLVWEGLNAAGALATMTAPIPLVSAVLAGGVALFALLRALLDLEFASFGLWLGIILALAMGYAAYVRYQESQLAQPPPAAPPPA